MTNVTIRVIILIVKNIILGDFIVKMSNNFISSDMIRGHIDTIILLSLVNGDKHTNEIRDEIENKAGGKYKVKQGTFYSALQRLAKHGLVSEYRSSTADSIRRKYLHLTEKGLEYVNKNIDEWNYSKNIINDMISDDNPIDETPTIKSFPIENAESEFESLLNNSQNIAEFDIKQDSSEDLDDYFKQINQTLQTEMENFNKTTPNFEEIEENNDFSLNESEFEAETTQDFEENVVIEENEQSYEEFIENTPQEPIEDNTEEIFVETEENIEQSPEILEEINEETVEENNEFIIQEENEEFSLEKEVILETSTETEEFNQTITDNTQEIETEDNLVDNSYVNDELLFGSDKKEVYSQLLDKLFPDREPEKVEVQETSNIEPSENYFEQITEFDDLVSEQNSFEPPVIEEKEIVYDEKPAFNYSIKKQTYDSSVKFDYSDIVEYANQEGFTVKTSYSTNKSEIGKVLINKLKFHASWLFFFTMLVELLLVCFVFKTNTGLNNVFYIVSGLLFLVLPIIYTVNYFSDKNKAIQAISTFRNTLEIVFIICLNLILLVCAFAIISDINFSSIVQLLRYIILPILLIVNIPLYYIYKYVLLQKSSYYTK